MTVFGRRWNFFVTLWTDNEKNMIKLKKKKRFKNKYERLLKRYRNSQKVKLFFRKYRLGIVLLLIFGCPFYCLLIGEIWNIRELYTFGLPLKDFMAIWIALCGIIGVAVNAGFLHKRIITQEKQLSDTHFSSGVELLGNVSESSRIGGIYSLFFLANEHRGDYLKPVCEILCAHVRTKTGEKEYQEKHKEKPSHEIQTVLDLLFKGYELRVDKRVKITEYIFDNCEKNLKGTFLQGADFALAQIGKVKFHDAELSGSEFSNAKATGAIGFGGTIFEGLRYQEIMEPGFSRIFKRNIPAY